jgi:hypothetical protein
MSWRDNLNNVQFSIITGDGKEYFPLLKITERSKEFNTKSFDFIDVAKSFVDRKQPKSTKYPLTFYFQGDDNIDQSNAFDVSSNDKRYWTVSHPFYGVIKGQPLSITFNDSNYNVTEVSVDFWESIIFDFPKSNFSIKDNTLVKKDAILESSAKSYASRDVFTAEDIQKNKESINITASKFNDIQDDDTFTEFSNIVSKAEKASDNLLKDTLNAINKANEVLNYPSTIDASVKNRLAGYKNTFLELKNGIESIADKLFFESQGASCLASYCNASVNFQFGEDYTTAIEIEGVVSDLIFLYNDYLLLLDSSSTSNYNTTEFFQPSALVQSQMNDLINLTIGNLFTLAFDSQQERVFYTDKETNLILLTHKYLGLDASDNNINQFREINNIKLNELLRIKKGRKIKYYI